MKTRNLRLDLIKGISMVMVLITHMDFTSWERKLGLFPFWIDMAIPVFMAITGYLYSNSYDRNRIDTLDKAYERIYIRRRLVSYTAPYLVFLLIEVPLVLLLEEWSWGGY